MTHGTAPDARLGDATAGPEPEAPEETTEPPQPEKARVTVLCADPEACAREAQSGAALAEGVFFTRDLVNEPANVLTTSDFADRLLAMHDERLR